MHEGVFASMSRRRRPASWWEQVRSYQEEVASLREALKRTSKSDARSQLGLTRDTERDTSAAQRDRLLNSTAKLEKTGQRLTESRQMLAGMEVML